MLTASLVILSWRATDNGAAAGLAGGVRARGEGASVLVRQRLVLRRHQRRRLWRRRRTRRRDRTGRRRVGRRCGTNTKLTLVTSTYTTVKRDHGEFLAILSLVKIKSH